MVSPISFFLGFLGVVLSGGKFREDSRFSSKWTHQNDPPGTPRAAPKWQRAARTVPDARATNPTNWGSRGYKKHDSLQ